MSSPLATVYGKTRSKQMDLDRPDGCDHDRNTYHYRLVDGAMVLRGIALGHGWESRPMDWRGLSCYKQRGDMQMALITKESGRPEARKDKDEIMAKAKGLLAAGESVSSAARIIGVPMGTLHGWLAKEKKQTEKAKEAIESVDAGKPVRSMGCIEPELQYKATEVALEANKPMNVVNELLASFINDNAPHAKIHDGNATTAPISVDEPDDQGDIEVNYCHACGEPCEGQAAYCPDCAEYQDIPAPVMVEKEFDRKAFVLEIIESVMELSQLRNVPAEITVELIDAVLVVA